MSERDLSHLHALEFRLSNERSRLGASKTESERVARRVVVEGIEREIAGERKFLGLDERAADAPMTDDELLRELGAQEMHSPTSQPLEFRLFQALKAVTLDLRQLHAHHYSSCSGGCPADAAIKDADAVIAEFESRRDQVGRVDGDESLLTDTAEILGVLLDDREELIGEECEVARDLMGRFRAVIAAREVRS